MIHLKSLLQHHSSKASILWQSVFFTVQLSHPSMTTGKTIALTRRTFVGKVMSLLSRPCRRRRPSALDEGGISGLFSSGGPSVRSLTRYDGEVSELLVGRQGSRVSMRVARGSASLCAVPACLGVEGRKVVKPYFIHDLFSRFPLNTHRLNILFNSIIGSLVDWRRGRVAG